MKKIAMLLLPLLLILPIGSFAADRNLPDAIADVFQTPEWEGYAIPVSSKGNAYEGLPACYYYDEHNRAAAFVIMKKDDVNTLCVLEKEKDTWVIAAQSGAAIRQGDEIPFVSSETYDAFHVDYLRPDSQPYLGITVQKEKSGWVVSEISYFPDDVYIYVQIEENELRYAGDETGWEQVAVKGTIENKLELFDLEAFPLTIEAAEELFSAEGE